MSLYPAVDIKELVRSKTDLVTLIGESLTLQPRHGGRLFVGLCPFHDDHDPSFNVNVERQTYRCWVCQEGGDCFSYVMKYEGIGFREALVSLAQRAGVELPTQGPSDRREKDDKGELYGVLEWAQGEFHKLLQEGAPGKRARDYLQDRKFSQETIREFQLGFAPDQWDWLIERGRGRFSSEILTRAGLAKANEPPRGGFHDSFIDRVMFPIQDERGRVISFGGRILPDSRFQKTGKYINGTDTPVFHKSRVIFGFNKAREEIRRTGTAIVTEGYADCIKAHQAGVVNAVGTLGTALTETHVSLLKRSARRVVLVYDGDRAGIDAALRAIEKFLAQEVDLRILTLPDELDPDEFLDTFGVEEFRKRTESAPEAWAYQLQHSLQRHGDSVDGRRLALDEMLTLMTIVPGMAGSVKENVLVARVAQRLGLREEMTRRRLQELRSGRNTAPRRKVSAVESPAAQEDRARKEAVLSLQRSRGKDDLLESDLLQILFTAPQTIAQIRQEVGTDDFRNEAARELLAICYDLWDHGEPFEFSRLLNAVECSHLKGLAVWIDEQAAERNIADHLARDAADEAKLLATSPEAALSLPPSLLRQTLSGLKWRREVVRQESADGQLAAAWSGGAGLSPQMREMLARHASFHHQRAAPHGNSS